MPTSGSGTGTIITTGIGAASARFHRPIPYTLLTLERYAQIMGLNPVHFNQGFDETFFPVASDCPDVWFKYHWQRPGYASRYDLALAIADAEEDIARVLGYWPAPMWIAGETHKYDKFHRRYIRNTGWMPDVSGKFKSVNTGYGSVVSQGRRNVALAGSDVAITYSDADADGFIETATITVDISGTAAETILDRAWYVLNETCRFGVYTQGKNGAKEWEIRTPRSQSLSGTTLTFEFDSWQLIKHTLLDEYPQLGSPNPIDANDTDNLEASVDVYLEYADRSQPSALFSWAGSRTCTVCNGTGCTVCGDETRNGCLRLEDPVAGVVAPVPAAYDATNEIWTQSTITNEYEPENVQVWYLAGAIDDDYRMGYTCDPLSEYFARAISWLATARLEREPCGCGNAKESMMRLRQDLAIVSPEGNFVIGLDDVLDNPFGSRLGEVRAWRRIARVVGDARIDGVAI